MCKLIISVAFVLLIFPLSSTVALADATIVSKEQYSDIPELIDAYKSLQELRDIYGEEQKDNQLKKEREELRIAVKSFVIHRMNDEQGKAEHTKNVIHWTNTSADITFWIAHILLAFSLLAAAMEFYNARKIRSKAKRESVDFEIKLQGLAVKNSTYGILLLFVSLAFYFMYLKFVYPVTAV